MAKVIITLEDRRNENGSPTVALDMSGVPATLSGNMQQTQAVRISQMLVGMAACEERLGDLPAHRRQPCNQTIH